MATAHPVFALDSRVPVVGPEDQLFCALQISAEAVGAKVTVDDVVVGDVFMDCRRASAVVTWVGCY